MVAIICVPPSQIERVDDLLVGVPNAKPWKPQRIRGVLCALLMTCCIYFSATIARMAPGIMLALRAVP